MRKLTHEEILAERQKNKHLSRNPVSICLNDVRSLYNVGAIFRVADGIRAEKVYLCGITGKPPHRAITKTALGAESDVPWEYCKSAEELLVRLKSSGYQIVVLEHTDESADYGSAFFSFPVCLVAGNEVSGIDPELLKAADLAIEVPMRGEKNSLNVAVATGIVCYRLVALLERGRNASALDAAQDWAVGER